MNAGEVAERLDALDLLVDAAAAYRLTKLVTDDSITQEPRDRIIRWAYATDKRRRPLRLDGAPVSTHQLDKRPHGSWQDVVTQDLDPPKVAELITCRWCAGLWCSMFVVCASRVAPKWWRPMARVLALGAASAWLARLED